MNDTKIYGTKISFGEDKFKSLSSKNEFKLLKDIHTDDSDYKKLSISQQYITNLMNNYSEFSPKIKNKYLSVCKTKIKDRYGKHIFRHTILNYPDHKDKSFSEEEEFSKHGKISFGDCKGQPINDLTKEQVLYYI